MTSAPDRAVPFFDIADPAFSVTSAQVRQAREAGWYARTSYGLAVLRYDQVSRLIRHPGLRQGSRLWPAHHGITSGPFADWWASWVLNMEGEEHHRLRRLLNPAFSRRIVEPLRPRFGALAGELVDGFAEPGRCEFMAEFAEPYAARVIAILLGIAEEEWPTIAAESAAVGLAMGVRIREHLPRIEAALAALYDYADALIADRQRSPRDDFVTCLVQAQAGAPGPAGEREAGGREAGGAGLTAAELRDSLVLLIFGGFDTTRNQLGLAMQAFLDHPAQWRLLAERPELGPAAVEEVMRIRPTTTWVTREATADFTFDGLAIRAGTTIHLFCESAGSDPGDADDAGPGGAVAGFDITAGGRRPHFGFGGGIHYCLGHYVARTDMCEALTVLARRLREPRPGGEAAWLPDSGNTGPVRLPIAFVPGQ
ncbi:MAG TPA: cytochrome P450 [Streptosporangiaceae bacterium]|nr:cytochrome P450 [Streptosporangiaceae bacterium]